MTIKAINPLNGETIKVYEELSPADICKIIDESHNAFLAWRKTDFDRRASLVKSVARTLRDNEDEYAKLMALEMGKLIKSGRAEVEKCAWLCEYYADNAESFLQSEMIDTGSNKSFVTFQPLGVVLAVMPWNFPFWQVFRFAVPAIMAGNTIVLKHASNVPGCALALEKIFGEAGFPANVFRTLLVGSDKVDIIIAHPMIRAVTLTGGTKAGKAVAKKAGEMLKKTVLELGGSDPYVILDDADLDQAVIACVTSRLINSGQSCVAAKRFIVVESQREQFEALMVEKMKAAKVGDPSDESAKVGPLARHDLRDDLHRQVMRSIEKGAQCLIGGEVPESKGAFYPATVLTDIKPGMQAYDEELFGPVVAIIPVKDEKDAISVANDSSYGLGAAIFTKDIVKGERIATEDIEAGCCFVNTFVQSDPRLPFGGIKESGYGRELSHYGIKEFVNVKTIVIG